MAELNAKWQRDFDVYDRIKKLGIDLGTKEAAVPDPAGRRICMVTFTPAGLVFTSGTGGGTGPVTNDDDDVKAGLSLTSVTVICAVSSAVLNAVVSPLVLVLTLEPADPDV